MKLWKWLVPLFLTNLTSISFAFEAKTNQNPPSTEAQTIEEEFPSLTIEEAKALYVTEEEYFAYQRDLEKLRSFVKTLRSLEFKNEEEKDRWMKEQNYGGVSKLAMVVVGRMIFAQIDWNF